MNNEYRNILRNHNLHPLKYERKNNVLIITTNANTKYVLKKNCNNYEIYNYLKSRNFHYFPDNLNDRNSNYDLSIYVDDNSLNDKQKLNDLILILSILHHKTSFKALVDLDEIKDIYEKLNNKIEKVLKYYNDLNDYLDNILLPSPSEYLLLRNISLFYYLLNYSKKKLDDWYKRIKDEKIIRQSLIHNNVNLEHLLVNNNYYLVSWDNSKFDMPINDIYNFYQKYYRSISFNDLINTYQSINILDQLELDLLLVKLSIPDIINFSDNTYKDNVNIVNNLIYLNNIFKYIKNVKEKLPINNNNFKHE